MKHFIRFISGLTVVAASFLSALPIIAQTATNKTSSRVVSVPYDGGKPIENALRAARRDGKNVLVQSCAQGCTWCFVCEKLLTTNPELVAKIKRDFVYVLVDTTNDRNRDFYKKYAGDTDHTLVLVVLNADGKELAGIIGFDIVQPDPTRPSGYSIRPEHIMEFLNKWSPKS
jgi:thioredoxin-related protein